MVRVNFEKGAHMELNSEIPRQTQTVRVLKPPGGGSSISFEEDVLTPPRYTLRSGSNSPSTPSTPGELFNDVTSLKNGSNGNVVPPNKPELAPSPKLNGSPATNCNGSATSNVLNGSPATNCNGSATSNGSPAANGSSATNGSPVVNGCNAANFAEKKENVSVENVSAPVKETIIINTSSTVDEFSKMSISTSSTTNTKTTNGVSAIVENGKTCIPNGSPTQNGSATTGQNGHKGVSSPFGSISPSGSYSPTNSSPPSTPSCFTPKDRVDSPTSSQEGRPRVVRDHMRSRIFMADEDYTPTRSSRANQATINDKGMQSVQSAGQRQRVPPGGFSSKLW